MSHRTRDGGIFREMFIALLALAFAVGVAFIAYVAYFGLTGQVGH